MTSIPTRQVHLDFHTSEHIHGVGAKFDEGQWQKALKIAHVNSVTVFAKCHHSWSYYPTKIGRKHPHLKTDLMGRQIKACHAIGVRAPIYYAVGWSANDAEDHPEWCCRDKAGKIDGFSVTPDAKPGDPKPAFSWKHLCPSGKYKELMLAQTREICEMYPVDGFFYDICMILTCRCKRCLSGMKSQGLDSASDSDVRKYNLKKWVSFMSDCNAIIHERHPEATIFYNGLATPDIPAEIHGLQTHFELEDLPTTWGGYDKFPPRAKYFSRTGKQLLAMSGKFHTAWGEFGGFKHPDAIRFEAASMIAYGARCSFGDQLHPSGEMSLATYRNIGAGYDYVRRIEEFGLDGRPCNNLGVWSAASPTTQSATGPVPGAHEQGIASMLMEAHREWDVVMPDDQDLSRFQTIILAGEPSLSSASAKRLTDYVSAGGSLLVIGSAALNATKSKFLVDVGGKYVGPARFEVDYTRIGKPLADDLPDSPFLNYNAAIRVKPTDGKVMAWIREPYFDRTHAHYCSHQNTPYVEKDAACAAGLQKGRVIYLAHALGKLYAESAARVHRQMFVNALDRLHTSPAISVKGLPSAGRISLIHQPQHKRFCIHILYSPPLQRSRCQVLEDFPPLFNLQVELRVKQAIRQVALPLENAELKLVRGKAGVTSFTVPKVIGHQVVTANY